jgi:2-oxoglutarate ferredoxin oxidoreductase subunit alpha
MSNEIVIMVGGEAGQGVQSVGAILSGALADAGLHVFADQDYESRVRGGHNFFRIRAATADIHAVNEKLDILVALNRETVELHRRELNPGGIIIYDAETIGETLKGKRYVDVPLVKLATEAGTKLMANTVAVGAVLGAGNLDLDMLGSTLEKEFGKHGKKMVTQNRAAARAGHDHIRSLGVAAAFPAVRKKAVETGRVLMNGNDAVALGALAAGCRFVSGYPMTPASSVMEYIVNQGQQVGAVGVHVEDEIAGLNMAVGAGFAGARAMVATSGGGFALMVEALSLAGMTETPVVIFIGQRPGPATGLPTRTEQGELWFALHAGHGEFPRAILTPSTPDEAFEAAVTAFNLAEKYQTPVFILSDHHLATSFTTIDKPDLGKVVIDRGELLTEAEIRTCKDYLRHAVTRSGVSKRALPGRGAALVVTDSDEHDEAGHMIEDAATRNRQVEKRQRKNRGLAREVLRPVVRRTEGARLTLIGWGSTGGAIREAAALLKDEGFPVDTLQLRQVWPFPVAQVTAAVNRTGTAFVVENNPSGQLARLMRRETGIVADAKILKYDGRPFTPEIIARRVRKEVSTW